MQTWEIPVAQEGAGAGVGLLTGIFFEHCSGFRSVWGWQRQQLHIRRRFGNSVGVQLQLWSYEPLWGAHSVSSCNATWKPGSAQPCIPLRVWDDLSCPRPPKWMQWGILPRVRSWKRYAQLDTPWAYVFQLYKGSRKTFSAPLGVSPTHWALTCWLLPWGRQFWKALHPTVNDDI